MHISHVLISSKSCTGFAVTSSTYGKRILHRATQPYFAFSPHPTVLWLLPSFLAFCSSHRRGYTQHEATLQLMPSANLCACLTALCGTGTHAQQELLGKHCVQKEEGRFLDLGKLEIQALQRPPLQQRPAGYRALVGCSVCKQGAATKEGHLGQLSCCIPPRRSREVAVSPRRTPIPLPAERSSLPNAVLSRSPQIYGHGSS